jgi:hypothetical protein
VVPYKKGMFDRRATGIPARRVTFRNESEADMRALGSVLGLLMVVVIAGLTYKFYFQKSLSVDGAAKPAEAIDVAGVKSDLLAIAQAERLYQVQHDSYGSMDDLLSSGAMSMRKSGRGGYTYDVSTSADSFQVVAHCPVQTTPGCTGYSIDQTMEIQSAP